MHRSSCPIRIGGQWNDAAERMLTPDALQFLAELECAFRHRRIELLEGRRTRRAGIRDGVAPRRPSFTHGIREEEWSVAPAPPDLVRRTVEITGPTDRKMVINALNSGADCFMADFEDSLSPTWDNVIEGQANLYDAVRRQVDFTTDAGKRYQLSERPATLLVRPRGWHLDEPRMEMHGQPMSASLFDFGLFFFHNAAELLERGSGPYFYLPKLEGHLGARLWSDIFTFSEARMNIPRGTVRATVLIEHILAALEMDEILYELRDYSAGLNAGRWDYIFSAIKTFASDPEQVLPDRADVTMNVPFMRAYAQELVRTCHRRGAHAMGGMAAFIPNRRDPELNQRALAAVEADKRRESGDGFDGTWVAHPDLVPVARAAFEQVLDGRPNQLDAHADDPSCDERDLLALSATPGAVTRHGVRLNVSVALEYLTAWFEGRGAVAINNLMEDTATAEISRAQLWQWIRHGVSLDGGEPISRELYMRHREEAARDLSRAFPDHASAVARAARLLDHLVLAPECAEFLTVVGLEELDRADEVDQERGAA